MSKMIHSASNFQYSVNIAYDLNNREKLQSFIPTKSSLTLLKDILLSTQKNATNRARILIGAYGKGKSHIVLSILSMLKRENREYFSHLNKKIGEDRELSALVNSYYRGKTKLLPVLISGTSTNLSQAFVLSLQRTLDENNLMNIMPETNYTAAMHVVEKWQKKFPETLKQFEKELDIDAKTFVEKMKEYDVDTYRQFEDVYPMLTAGSTFNPFVGFDVVDLYESVAKALKQKTKWSGLYVVYDEFSKYLEASISTASVSDTKMLQDFAEKSTRSGDAQLHLMLISHKEIANYIDRLPKQKTDGWRGIAERFEHVLLNNNFSQVYEIISTVIQKDDSLWKAYVKKNKVRFEELAKQYEKHTLFSEMNPSDAYGLAQSCFPLHPVSTFILPRLSERIAQNERTLFTYLSAQGTNTLTAFLRNFNDSTFQLVTPDAIFDYFEVLFKKEVFVSEIRDTYILACRALEKISNKKSLEAKIVKTLCLMYILQQFEKIKPTKEEIFRIYRYDYSEDEITSALDNLLENLFVVYLRQSNSYLKIKETSGVDIEKSIKEEMERQNKDFCLKDVLNKCNSENHLYPARYNDEKEMVRWFDFLFVTEGDIQEGLIQNMELNADGRILAVILEDRTRIKKLRGAIEKASKDDENSLFILPKQFVEVDSVARKYSAVNVLREKSSNDTVLSEEYQIILDDLNDILHSFIADYVRAERGAATYYYCGEDAHITRKAELSEKMSVICETVFAKSPIIKNEAVNKKELTTVMANARDKVVSALLRSELEENLGLTGSGPDVFTMRSTLVNTGILKKDGSRIFLNFDFSKGTDSSSIKPMLGQIFSFVAAAQKNGQKTFDDLYDNLLSPKSKIGVRKGLIPIYLAAVLHEFRKSISIRDRIGQATLSAQTLNLINANPDQYTLRFVEWNADKESYVQELRKNFSAQLSRVTDSESVTDIMRRWYVSLPKYSKELASSKKLGLQEQKYADVLKLLNSSAEIDDQDLLFTKLPKIFVDDCSLGKKTRSEILNAQKYFDEAVVNLKEGLIAFVKELFVNPLEKKNLDQMSLASVCKDWRLKLDKKIFERVFNDGTDRMLTLFADDIDSEVEFISSLARAVTGLYIEDWNVDTIELFKKAISRCKENAETFIDNKSKDVSGGYKLTFETGKGTSVTKTFEKVELSSRSRLLRNKVTDALGTMGQALTEAEKRQVLVDILQEMCGGTV